MGPVAGRWSPPPQRGFTLIELLVALVVAAVAISMIAFNGFSGGQRGLRFEAERMAQILALASEEAQLRGTAIRLQADDSGYRFLVLRERRWLPLLDDEDLRERRWDESTRIALLRPDGYGQVEFGRDVVDVPFSIELVRDQARVTIHANGLGMFDVR